MSDGCEKWGGGVLGTNFYLFEMVVLDGSGGGGRIS